MMFTDKHTHNTHRERERERERYFWSVSIRNGRLEKKHPDFVMLDLQGFYISDTWNQVQFIKLAKPNKIRRKNN